MNALPGNAPNAGHALTPLYIEKLEKQISEEVAKTSGEVFGNRKVTIRPNHPDHQQVQDFLTELIANFPASQGGSKFINSHCTVKPFIYVKLDKSLFIDSVTQFSVQVDPLSDQKLGNFTREAMKLKVTNIRSTSDFEFNDYVPHSPRGDQTQSINQDSVVGDINTNPDIEKSFITADVDLGNLIHAKNVRIEVITENSEDAVLIPIEKLTTVSKILPDGSFVAVTKVKAFIEQYEGNDLLWINYPYTLELYFPTTKEIKYK